MTASEPIVSVIVPVYNVELYLERCINSIKLQTFSNIEVILVDDGSNDSSPIICDAAKDDERFVVIHKKNGGLSSARNAGLDVAKGKYVCFIDSDDYIEFDMIEKLLNKLVQENAQISTCNVFKHTDEETRSQCLSIADENINFYGKDLLYFFDILGAKLTVLCTNRLFLNSIIQEHNIRFVNEKTVLFEDRLFIIHYFHFVKIATFVNESLYHYCFRNVSLTQGKDLVEIFNQYINLTKESQKFLDKYQNNDDVTFYVFYWNLFCSACNHLKKPELFYRAISLVTPENMKFLKKVFLSVAVGKSGTIIAKRQNLSFKAMLFFRYIALMLWIGKYDVPINKFLLPK